MPGLKLGGKTLNNLRYASDTIVIAKNEGNLQNLVNVVKK